MFPGILTAVTDTGGIQAFDGTTSTCVGLADASARCGKPPQLSAGVLCRNDLCVAGGVGMASGVGIASRERAR